jgi:hypothetical protein
VSDTDADLSELAHLVADLAVLAADATLLRSETGRQQTADRFEQLAHRAWKVRDRLASNPVEKPVDPQAKGHSEIAQEFIDTRPIDSITHPIEQREALANWLAARYTSPASFAAAAAETDPPAGNPSLCACGHHRLAHARTGPSRTGSGACGFTECPCRAWTDPSPMLMGQPVGDGLDQERADASEAIGLLRLQLRIGAIEKRGDGVWTAPGVDRRALVSMVSHAHDLLDRLADELEQLGQLGDRRPLPEWRTDTTVPTYPR